MKKKYFTPIAVIGLFGLTMVLASCSLFSQNKNTIVFALKKTDVTQTNTLFLNAIKENFYEIAKDTNYGKTNYNFQIKEIEDERSKMDLLENGSLDFAFLTSKNVIDKDFYQKVNPLVQTLTTSFKFDKNISDKYLNGTETDPLRKIAMEMQDMSFGKNYEYPFSTWKNEKGEVPMYDWNGIRYNHFYDETSLTNHYRGMILLSGTDEQIKQAKDAWNIKNFEDFRNLGIIVGDNTSMGNYKLQENLIKIHFELGANFTLAEDKKNHENKYDFDKYGTEKIGKTDKIISFTDEGSFAWTNAIINDQSYRPIQNKKIEIITVTNPYLYDLGVFSKNVDNTLANFLAKAIEQTYLENNNLYGNSFGYNGYKVITNFESEVLNQVK